MRLRLSVIAYNLGSLWRRLVLPTRIATWSLTSLQQRLVKTAGRLIQHARYYWLLLAENHLTRHLFSGMLQKIGGASVAGGLGCSLGAADSADEIGGQRDECARTAVEKHHFPPAGIKAGRIGPCASLLGLKTRRTLPFANYRVSMRA